LSARSVVAASATVDGSVTVWDVATQTAIAVFQHRGRAQSVAISEDDAALLSTGIDGRAVIWNLAVDVSNPGKVRDFVECHVPYILVGTKVEPRSRWSERCFNQER
jgi:WD40 repeat protein